ncbi:transducin-like enhancer protein 3-like, partial [Aphelenchoides avenae]
MENPQIRLIDNDGGSEYLLKVHTDSVLSVKFSPDGEWFASSGKDGRMALWRSPYGALLTETDVGSSALACDISADGSHVVVGNGNRNAAVYN